MNAANNKTLQMLIRYLEISSYERVMQVVNTQHGYARVTLRKVVKPSANMLNQKDPWLYDYSSSSLKYIAQMSISDARLTYQ